MTEGSLENFLRSCGVSHINQLDDHHGTTPLHCLLFGWLRIGPNGLAADVKLLLAHGADPNAVSSIGTSCFQVACVRSSREIIKLLASHGALLEGVVRQLSSPFEMSVMHQRWDIAEWLVARGVSKPTWNRDLVLLRERWRVRWFLVRRMRKHYRLPVEVAREVMQWI